MKQVLNVIQDPRPHWVGNGFPMQSILNLREGGETASPFLLMDYSGETAFPPARSPNERRGVGEHPHRGFETVTIVYAGEVSHRDSTGAGGTIVPGGVQWMTAGSGILHEEFHSPAYTQSGGPFEMVQLWVNLPARDKMVAPAYQDITDADIPVVALPEAAGQVRVIAGEFEGTRGAARTHTPINVWDLRLNAGRAVDWQLPAGHTAVVSVLTGTVMVNGELLRGGSSAVLSVAGEAVKLEANNDAKLLVLTGEPLNEPIAAYGPFVMNTEAEIGQAFVDFQSGRFGALGRPAAR